MQNKLRMIRKVFFAYVRFKFKTKDKVGPLNENKSNVATENDEMCKILDIFVCSVFTDKDANILPEPKRISLGDDSNKFCNF